MIVRRIDSELVLVTQPDHAALSGRLMEAWRADDLPAHRERDTILLATREHDNGWLEVDRTPMLDASFGLPVDFVSIPDKVKRPIWPRAAARVGAMSPLAGALVAQHGLTVLARHRAEPSWAPFFETMEASRRQLWPDATSDAILDPMYRFVYLGDLLSLVFCNGWSESFDAYGYRLVLRGSRLEVTPDPFEGRTIDLRVTARRMPARRYQGQADLETAFGAACVSDLIGLAIGSLGP